MVTDLFEHNYIGVFTDGSSLIDKNKSFYEASSGYLIVINDVEVFRGQLYHNNGTNSIGEVYAMFAAIEKVEEIKRMNPELKDWFTFFVSDSQYVINSLTKFILSWKKQGYDKIWVGSSGDIVKYQKIFKHIQKTYLDNDTWYKTNVFLHIKGHLDKKPKIVPLQHKKFINFNGKRLNYKQKFVSKESFDKLIRYNSKVDFIADEARLKKIYYKEERLSDEKWEIKENKLPIKNQRVIIRSRNGSKL